MPSTDTNAPSDPSAKAGVAEPDSNFHLRFTVEGGREYVGGLYQWMTVLNVRGGAPTQSSMLLTRHNGDLIGRPVGLFSDSIPVVRAQQMAARLDALASATLPKPTKGDVNASALQLDYRHGSRVISIQSNARSLASLGGAINPVMDDLRALMSALLTKPERALSVSVENGEESPAGMRFRIRLTNIGTSDLIVADPRIVARGSPEPRAFMRVAPAPVTAPGAMEIPPRWRPLGLEPPPPDVPDEGLTIQPKESLVVLSALWTPIPGNFLAQAVWQDYFGPAKIDPLKVQPPIPKDAGPDTKPFVIRGAAFSSYLRFAINKK